MEKWPPEKRHHTLVSPYIGMHCTWMIRMMLKRTALKKSAEIKILQAKCLVVGTIFDKVGADDDDDDDEEDDDKRAGNKLKRGRCIMSVTRIDLMKQRGADFQ